MEGWKEGRREVGNEVKREWRWKGGRREGGMVVMKWGGSGDGRVERREGGEGGMK